MVSIVEVLENAYQKWGNNPFIYEKKDDVFVPCTFKEFIESVFYLSKGLDELGLNNSKFMLFSENSLNYLLCDTAITGVVGISINVDKNYKFYDLNNVILICQPDVIFYSSNRNEVINSIKNKYPNIHYLELEKEIPRLIQIGKSKIKNQQELFHVRNKERNTCSKIILSSGSTSLPKAVMLSEENLLSGYDCVTSRIPLNEHQREYLFLPLSHIFASCSYYYSLLSGKKIYLSSGTNNIVEELKEVKPNFLITVPIICWRLYNSVNGNSELLKKAYGGNIDYMLVGGAAVERELKEKYRRAGIALKECYGMTEMASVLAGDTIFDNEIDSTGVLYSEYDYKTINEDESGIGELLVRKKDDFLGYYNDLESTKKVLDKDGFYHTGDLGKIVNDRFYFTRRKDRVILLPNGEKINPTELENLIMEKCPVSKVTIYLEGKRLKAILYSDIRRNCDKEMYKLNEELPSYKQIKDYEIKENSERIK